MKVSKDYVYRFISALYENAYLRGLLDGQDVDHYPEQQHYMLPIMKPPGFMPGDVIEVMKAMVEAFEEKEDSEDDS